MPGPAGNFSDSFVALDATAQAELVRRREVQPAELVEAAIRRIEVLNPQLNAVVSTQFEESLDRAARDDLPKGPFAGVPMLLKDDPTGAMAGQPLCHGMSLLRDLGWRARTDSYLTRKLLGAGFVPVGRTNLPELAVSITTEPRSFGPARNPWDLARSPGGSSGGSAAAVAAGLVPLAHGSDAGGSIRIPSSVCGLVGLKPSRGRVSLGPEFGDLWGYGIWVAHVLTRSVRDSAAVLDVLAGYMPGDPHVAPAPARPFVEELQQPPGRLRIGFTVRTRQGATPMHRDCVQAVLETAKLLESLGHHVEEAHPPELDEVPEPASAESTLRMAGAAVQWTLRHWSEQIGRPIDETDVEPYTWALGELGRPLSAEQFIGALAFIQERTRRMAAWWRGGFDLLLTPTIAVPPFALGELAPGADPIASLFKATSHSPFCGQFNATGQPAVSLPLHWNAEGLPVGLHFVADYGQEATLLRLAAQLEQARPWQDRWPAVHA
jgi:amidase